MPIDGFEDFDACVASMQDDGHDEESARSICGALEQESKADAGSVEELRDALEQGGGLVADVGVDLLSGVDVPAVDSKWVMFKSGGGRRGHDYRVNTPVLIDKADDGEKRIAYAAAMIPREPDKEGDVVPTPVVENAAHKFLKGDGGVDTDHSLIDGDGEVIESWVLKEERTFDLPGGGSETYPPGTWMVGIEWGADAWERIQDGELTGLSIYGMAEHVPLERGYARSEGATPNTDPGQTSEQNQSMTDPDTPDGDAGDGGTDDGPTLGEVAASVEELSDTVSAVKEAVDTDKQPDPDAAAEALAGEYSLSEGEVWEVLDLADDMGVDELMDAVGGGDGEVANETDEDEADEKSDTESADTETAEKRTADANTGKAGSRGRDTAAKAAGDGAASSADALSYQELAEQHGGDD